jgi:hypothetical protein
MENRADKTGPKKKYLPPMITELGDEVIPIAATSLSPITTSTESVQESLEQSPTDVQEAVKKAFTRF